MRMSMWMLAERLKRYDPVMRIESGEPILRGVRILHSDTTIEQHNVYIIPARDVITNGGDQVICVQGHDMIILNTTDVGDAFNAVLDAFDIYNNWYDSLVQKTEEGCSLQDLLDESHRVFDNPLIVYNAEHIALAHSKEYDVNSLGNGLLGKEWNTILNSGSNSLQMLSQLREHMYRTKNSHQVLRLNFPFVGKYSWQRMLYQDGIMIGRIIMLEVNTGYNEHYLSQMLNVFGDILERWNRKNDDRHALSSDTKLFEMLTDGASVNKKELDHQQLLAGWTDDDDKILFGIDIPGEYSNITWPLFTKLQRAFPECYIWLKNRRIYILADLNIVPLESLEEKIKSLQRQSPFHCASSFTFQQLDKINIYAKQLDAAMQFTIPGKTEIVHCRDCALDYLRSCIHSQIDSSVVHDGLRVLLEYDKKNGTAFYHTLFVFLRNRCSLVDTARALNLHRNSLVYRIRKIVSLTGIHLDDADEREYLYISFLVSGDAPPV